MLASDGDSICNSFLIDRYTFYIYHMHGGLQHPLADFTVALTVSEFI